MSEDSFTEVTNESWFSRIGAAIKGVFIGIVIFLIGFPLLFWNEGRAVRRQRALEEGASSVISVEVANVDPAHNGKLIHLTGATETSEVLQDPKFGISASALKLKRQVEMYQWEEDTKTKSEKKLGGGKKTTTTYNYAKTWSSSHIDSSSFKKAGHSNPGSMPYETETLSAENVTIGPRRLSKSLIDAISNFEPFPLTEELAESLPEDMQGTFRFEHGGFYSGTDSSKPEVGDLRIKFLVVQPGEISLVSKQQGNSFEPYITSNNQTLELLQIGVHGADAMFQKAQQENTIFTWILRGVGWLVMFIGLSMVLKPISVLADVVPFLGDLAEMGLGFVAAVIAFCCALITIAIAWIFYRPLIAIILLIIVGGAVYLFIRKRGKVVKAKAA